MQFILWQDTTRRKKINHLQTSVIVYLSLSAANIQAASDQTLKDDLAFLRAENYVYSAGKKMQSVKDIAAAIFVISQEDIHRSGASTIPDVLRMAPGLEVVKINANKWAISVRGFNDQYSSKLLVMIDGRTLYSPIFSGVYWQREDTLLEDVDRIEVIRGAGAAIWGSNAVNGVINIITKKAKDTQGALLTIGGGNQEQAFANARYGNKIGNAFDYRIYAKGFKRNHNFSLSGENTHDDLEGYQGGFKSEWRLNQQDTVLTQGDIYHIHTGDMENYPFSFTPSSLEKQDSSGRASGGNIQTRWQHKFSEVSDTALQFYYKQDDHNSLFVTPHVQHSKTLDVDFQYRLNLLKQHDIMWGLNYRYFEFSSSKDFKLSFNPAKQNLQLFTGFLQDDIVLLENQLKLTLGTRLEHNDFTGFEVQPNIRLLWTPSQEHSIWGAISRAIRTPSLADTSIRFRLPAPNLPAAVLVSGNPDFKSESVLDYELGYRGQFFSQFSFDITGFYNKYHRLRLAKVGEPYSTGSYLEIPARYTNNAKGETMGIEVTTQWQPADWLKMQASYSLLKENVVVFFVNQASKSPHQRFHFKANLNLPFDIEIDPMLRYVDNDVSHNIPHYIAFDLRAAWKPTKNLELSIVGQNLLDNAHFEYSDEIFAMPTTEIRRSIFGKLTALF
jgi:iron complex outermembrane receptor protein